MFLFEKPPSLLLKTGFKKTTDTLKLTFFSTLKTTQCYNFTVVALLKDPKILSSLIFMVLDGAIPVTWITATHINSILEFITDVSNRT